MRNEKFSALIVSGSIEARRRCNSLCDDLTLSVKACNMRHRNNLSSETSRQFLFAHDCPGNESTLSAYPAELDTTRVGTT